MRKFTAFTILLTVIVIVVLAEMFVNDYLPNVNGFINGEGDGGDELSFEIPDSLKTSVLGSQQNKLGADVEGGNTADASEATLIEGEKENAFSNSEFMDLSKLSEEYLPVEGEIDNSIFDFGEEEIAVNNEGESIEEEIGGGATKIPDSSGSAEDFEDSSYVSANTAYLRDEQVKSAGFVGARLEDEDHYNALFKTISIEDLYDTEVSKVVVKTDNALMAKIYVFKVGIQAEVDEVYQLLKLRSSQSSGVSINETNEYGAASFYMNDPGRESTAFLTARVGGLIYAFSYPKEYHSQIKNLIKLLEWELG